MYAIRSYYVRIGQEKGFDGGQALGHPGPLVEQARGLEEGGEVNLHRLATQILKPLYAGGKQRLGLVVAEKCQLLRARHAKAESSLGRRLPGPRAVADRVGPGVGIGGIELRRHLEQPLQILGAVGQQGHAIQAATGRHQTTGTEQSLAGLETEDVV